MSETLTAKDTLGGQLSDERLHLLTQLPLLLNSSLEPLNVIRTSLAHLTKIINAEAATVFLVDEDTGEITFWALRAKEGVNLDGKKMPARRGIVGWVIEKNESVLCADVYKDPRFFADVDLETQFRTKDLICVPLIVRGEKTIGAIQVLNSSKEGGFKEEDVLFLEKFSHQAALAISNAILHRALEERTLKLEKLDRRKNEMISVIAHEFRTPVNVILNSADLLSSGLLKDEAAQKKTSDLLIKGVTRLTSLIDRVGQMALVSDDAIVLKREQFTSSDIFAVLKAYFDAPARERSITLDFEDMYRGIVEADRELLTVVFKNLISNGIRFTEDGGRVTVSSRQELGLVTFSVADTGIGIRSAEQPVIFEKFYEVNSALQHSSGQYEFQSGGLGIGLATAKAILLAHGSKIEVRSEQGKGAVFSFSLSKPKVR